MSTIELTSLEEFEPKAWKIIENIGWKTKELHKRASTSVKAELIREYHRDLPTLKLLSEFVQEKRSQLYRAVENYENDHHTTCGSYGGDDSFGDMLYDIIGAGKDKFNATLYNPEKELDGWKYHESFGYVLPYTDELTYNGAMKFVEPGYNEFDLRALLGELHITELQNEIPEGQEEAFAEGKELVLDLLREDVQNVEILKGFRKEKYDYFRTATGGCYLSNVMSDLEAIFIGR